MGHVFISYSRKDKEYVDKLYEHLLSLGLNPWFDQRLKPFEQWMDEIETTISTSSAFILIASEHAKKSKWVKKELAWADYNNIPIFTLILSGDIWFAIGDTSPTKIKNHSLPPEKFFSSLKEIAEKSPKAKTVIKSENLSAQDWLSYLEATLTTEELQKANKIKDILIPLRTKTKKLAIDELHKFLDDKDEFYRILIVEGDALIGKTFLVSSFINERIENLLESIKEIMKQAQDDTSDTLEEDLYHHPQDWIPLFFSLRGEEIPKSQPEILYDKLLQHLNNNSKKTWKTLTKALSIHHSRWLFYFDGLDEIWNKDYRIGFLNAIKKLHDEFPNVKIVISARPYVIPSKLFPNTQYKIIQLDSLSNIQITNYFNTFIDKNLSQIEIDEENKTLSQIRAEKTEKLSRPATQALSNTDFLKICGLAGNLALLIEHYFPGVTTSLLESNQDTVKPENLPTHENPKTLTQEEYRETRQFKASDFGVDVSILISDSSDRQANDEQNDSSQVEDDSDVPPLSPGVVVFHMYQTLWSREEKRVNPPLDYQQLYEETIELAAELGFKVVDKSPPEFFRRESSHFVKDEPGEERIISAKEKFNWLLNLGIIKKIDRSYHFYSYLTLIIFATRHIMTKPDNLHQYQQNYKQFLKEDITELLRDFGSTISLDIQKTKKRFIALWR